MPHANFNAKLPTLWLIGDSTVKEGRDNGLNGGRWGWGHEIVRYFDLAKVNVENQALGGTSSRSFITGGWWESVQEMIKPGDVVLIQFGHNDGGLNSKTPRIRARGTLRGSGDESMKMEFDNGETETVHTYGWYLEKYITEIRTAGATPVVCSLIPRNRWKDDQMIRSEDDGYAGWAEEVAIKTGADFINLNHIICDTLDPLGADFSLGALFRPDDGTHTTLLGAQVNAYCVVAGVKKLSNDHPLHKWLGPSASSVEPTRGENVISRTVSTVAE